jgi:hypothetical protein
MQALSQGCGANVDMHNNAGWTMGDSGIAISGRHGGKLNAPYWQ